jgi:ABC-type cobalt transport system, permease component CbiQ and related transporters
MNVVIGQYADIDTFLHKLHPMTKLLGVFILISITLLFASLPLYLLQIAILVVFLLLVRLPLTIMLKSLWSAKFLFIFIFIFNMIFVREGTPIWQWGILAVYPRTIIITVQLVLRLLLLTSYATILTLTTKPLDLTYAIEDRLGFLGIYAHIFGMILSIALRFIPTLQEETDKIMKAQKSRGATFDEGKLFKRIQHIVALLIPLFIVAFNRAEVLSTAMEIRGYNPEATRTRYHVLEWQQKDNIICLFLCCYLIGAILIKIFIIK